MVTLYNLADQLEEGDEIKWLGVDSDVVNFDQMGLREVIEVTREDYRIIVEGEGPGDAPVKFWVDQDEKSKVVYNEKGRDMGEVRRAEVPSKNLRYIR